MKTNHDKIIVKIICGQNKGNISRFKISKIKYNHPNILNYIKTRYKDSNSINETINRMKFGGPEIVPKCPVCGKPTIYKYKNIYTLYCSHECAYKSKEVYEKKKQTSLKHYGVSHPMRSKEIKEKVKNTNIEIYGAKTFAESKFGQKYFEENKELLVKKTEEGIFKKYGVKNYQQSEEYQNKKDEILEKRKETNLKRFGETSYSKTDEWKQSFQNKKQEMLKKMKETCLKKYGREWYFQTEDSKQKNYITQKKNGTFGKSKPEVELKNFLLNYFPDLIYQYKSKEYPWKCDYYIPTYKLFIELQGSWFHGNKPYDPNDEECIELVNLWKSKPNGFYKRALYGYTVADVKKRNWVKTHKLNFIEIFDYSDFNKILNDINTYIKTYQI